VAGADGDAGALSTSDGAGFLWDPRLASHVYREDHPLKPRRLIGVHDTLARIGAFDLPNAVVLAPRDATIDEIERIHAGRVIGIMARSVDVGAGMNAHCDAAHVTHVASPQLRRRHEGHRRVAGINRCTGRERAGEVIERHGE